MRMRRQLVTVDGELVAVDRQLVTGDGELVTVDGDLVTADGDLVTVDRQLVTVDGDLVTVDRQLIAVDGELVTVDGELAKYIHAIRMSLLCHRRIELFHVRRLNADVAIFLLEDVGFLLYTLLILKRSQYRGGSRNF